MFVGVHVGTCGVAGILILQHGKVRVVKYREQLVLEGRVDGPVLVVQPSLFCVLSEESILLRGRRP